MTRLPVVAGLLAGSLVAVAALAGAAPLDRSGPPPLGHLVPRSRTIVETHLSNGVRVLVQERHDAPAVAISIVSGPWQDARFPPSLVTRAALGGTRNHRFYVYDLANSGTFVEDGATPDAVVLRFYTVTPALPDALELAAEAVSNASFRKSAVADACTALHSRLNDAADDPSAFVRRLLFAPGHPYRPLDANWIDSACLDPEALRARWKEAFDPAHATIVVTGDTRAPVLLPLLERNFGALPRPLQAPKSVARRPAPSDPDRLVLINLRSPRGARIAVGGLAPPDGSADAALVDLVGDLVATRAQAILRTQLGLTYYVAFTRSPRRGAGAWELSTHAPTDHTAEALRVLQHEMDRLCDELVPAAELTHDAERVLAQQAASSDSTAIIARPLELLAIEELPPTDLARRDQTLVGATPEDVRRVARAMFDPNAVRRAIAGDASALAPQVSNLGFGSPKIVTLAPR